jgi:hypothetical protein
VGPHRLRILPCRTPAPRYQPLLQSLACDAGARVPVRRRSACPSSAVAPTPPQEASSRPSIDRNAVTFRARGDAHTTFRDWWYQLSIRIAQLLQRREDKEGELAPRARLHACSRGEDAADGSGSRLPQRWWQVYTERTHSRGREQGQRERERGGAFRTSRGGGGGRATGTSRGRGASSSRRTRSSWRGWWRSRRSCCAACSACCSRSCRGG